MTDISEAILLAHSSIEKAEVERIAASKTNCFSPVEYFNYSCLIF